METYSFYMVYSPTGPYPPTVRHALRKEAVEVARQMAERHKTQFFVLRAELAVTPPSQPIVEQLRDNKEPCPF